MVKTGFTLIELLVVVTIIVVLLALLTPALDKAIYQAELAICGSRLHAAGLGFQTYTVDYRRHYPTRALAGSGPAEQIYAHVGTAGVNTWEPDDRPAFKGYIDINGMLNCPLTGPIDMVNNPTTTDQIYMPYTVWAGWNYLGEKGMRRMGDRMEVGANRFNILLNDTILRETAEGWGRGTHPDQDGIWTNEVWQDKPNPWIAGGATGNAYSTVTLSAWIGGPRGRIDANYAIQDGSVVRLTDIRWDNDPRMEWIIQYADKATFPTRGLDLPRTP